MSGTAEAVPLPNRPPIEFFRSLLDIKACDEAIEQLRLALQYDKQ